jgi:hypothetical protein
MLHTRLQKDVMESNYYRMHEFQKIMVRRDSCTHCHHSANAFLMEEIMGNETDLGSNPCMNAKLTFLLGLFLQEEHILNPSKENAFGKACL